MIQEEVARAFTVLHMNHDQIYYMRDKESKLTQPEINTFTSARIAKDFLNDKRPQISEDEIKQMNSLWLEFYTKILYPQQQAEELFHPEGCTMFTCYHPWDDRCKTKAQEMWQWEDFVMMNYKAPAAVKSLKREID